MQVFGVSLQTGRGQLAVTLLLQPHECRQLFRLKLRHGGCPHMGGMVVIIQLIEIAHDFALIRPGELHRIGQYIVVGLLVIKQKGVVCGGVFGEYLPLIGAECTAGAGKPDQRLVAWLWAVRCPLTGFSQPHRL